MWTRRRPKRKELWRGKHVEVGSRKNEPPRGKPRISLQSILLILWQQTKRSWTITEVKLRGGAISLFDVQCWTFDVQR